MRSLRPSSLSRTLALVPPAVALVSQHVTADFSAYMKIDSIPGEVTDKGHEGWIKIDAATWSVARTVNPGGAGGPPHASAPEFSGVTVAKPIDSTSPKLFLAAVTNDPTTVTIELFSVATGGGTAPLFYRITLTDALVINQSSAAADAGTPTEKLTFHFTTIQVATLNSQGGVIFSAGYNIETGKTF